MPHKVYMNKGTPIKAWTNGVPFEAEALVQVENLSQLPCIHKHIAIMPDVHAGYGSTVGSVIPTIKAIIPSAVGVDIGCGMVAVRTNIVGSDLPDNLKALREGIERQVPVGSNPKLKIGQWNKDDIPGDVFDYWHSQLNTRFKSICEEFPELEKSNNIVHLGTLGGGNHFIEVCLDEHQQVWVMLHSGSRGVGNRIGSFFIEKAKQEMERWFIHLPDKDLAYLPEGSQYFKAYVNAVNWAQDFAVLSRKIMMESTLKALCEFLNKDVYCDEVSVNCHHNYVQLENHFGKNVWLTRKGAVSARKGQLGIIPGSMGAKSFIVRGLGNEESFHSCSHGAGRVMSRTKAKASISMDEHKDSLSGIECKTDESTLDETPKAYKDIDAVMAAQSDLVEIMYTLKQVLCVKG